MALTMLLTFAIKQTTIGTGKLEHLNLWTLTLTWVPFWTFFPVLISLCLHRILIVDHNDVTRVFKYRYF